MSSMEIARLRQKEQFDAYEQWHRKEVAPNLGSTAMGATILVNAIFPVFEAIPEPNTEFREKSFSNEYSTHLGNVALFRQIARPELVDITESIYTGHAELADAA